MAERLYVSNKNETVRMFESDFMEFFSRVHPATPLVLYVPVIGYMLYILCMATPIVDCSGNGAVFVRRFALDADRISHPSVRISLRTEDASGKAVALCDSRRASRLSQRCPAARYAASRKHPARVSLLWSVSSIFWKPYAARVCRVGFRLCLL